MSGYRLIWDKDFFAEHGRHVDEETYGSLSEICPPGRIDTFTSPPTQRMRIASSDSWNPELGQYSDMPPTYDLIRTYKRMFAQGKVDAYGAGYEAYMYMYKWPEIAIAKARAGEQRGLSMDSFLNLLLKPRFARPSTFNECLNFFYPLSGTTPPEKSISPFVSTGIPAYYVPDGNTRSPGDLPLQLGEVSMMYGWFLAWRALLCPTTSGRAAADTLDTTYKTPDPNRPFIKTSEQLILDPGGYSQALQKSEDSLKTLAQISGAVEVIETLASMAAGADFEMPESFDELKAIVKEQLGLEGDDWVNELLHKYGIAAITNMLADKVPLPGSQLNDLATVVVNGAMSPEKWRNIKSGENDAFLQLGRKMVRSKLESVGDSYGVDMADLEQYTSQIEDFMMTGDVPQSLKRTIERLEHKIQTNGESALTNVERTVLQTYKDRAEFLERRASRILQDFTKYGDARANEPISLTILAIAATSKLVQGGIDYKARLEKNNIRGYKEYIAGHIWRLDPKLGDSDVSMDFSSHVRHGIWKTKAWFESGESGWYSANTNPDCLLQQGGQLLDYWTHVWSRVARISSRFSTQRQQFVEHSTLDNAEHTESLLSRRVKYNYASIFDGRDAVFEGPPPTPRATNYKGSPRQYTYSREESRASQRKSHCQGLGILAKHVDSSMRLVLENLTKFSPFTHAYGFAPTFQLQTNGRLKISGVAPRRFLGKSSLYHKDHHGNYLASPAPGRLYPEYAITLENAYGPRGVECYKRKSPLPSRRLLAGAFGQRCNLSFDVGLDAKVPVMDAQFCGLMAVLLCYPEALESCASMGLEWALKAQDQLRSWRDIPASLLESPTQRALRNVSFKDFNLAYKFSKTPLYEILAEGSPAQTKTVPPNRPRATISKAQADALKSIAAKHSKKPAATEPTVNTPKIIAQTAATTSMLGLLAVLAYKISKSEK